MPREVLRKNIWSATAEVCVKNVTLLISVVGGLIALDLFAEFTDTSGNSSVTGAIIWCFLAYAAHGTVLKGTVGLDLKAGRWPMFRFYWRSFLLSLLPVVLLLPLLFASSKVDEGNKEAMVLVFLVLSAPLYLITFALLGTSLPAIVDDGMFNLGRTLRRGAKTFFPTIGRLIVGPGTLSVVVLAFAVSYPFYQGEGDLFSETKSLQALNLIPVLFGTLVGAFLTVMLAVILSKAYVSGEEKLGPTITPDENPPTDDKPIIADSGSWTGS